MTKIRSVLILAAATLLASCSTTPTTSSSSAAETSSTPQSTTQPAESSAEQTTEPTITSDSAETTSTLPEIDYVKVFCETSWDYIWAWKGETNFFNNWPGESLQSYDENWKTYDFQGKTAPFNVIFSKKSGAQTPDLSVNSTGYWWYYQNNWYREDPLLNPPGTSEDDASYTWEGSLPSTTDELDNRHRTWYQLLVYSFADGNNDGIGDFKGIVDHLDYLQGLGIGGIWLSPIHPASHYHGYDVLDYYSVNSAYEVGGITFQRLLQECHNRDIKVLVDMVLNHTSKDHPWRSQHWDWYSGEQVFSEWMPDLNYDNLEVREEIKNVGRYWLNQGVDGFRCDGAAWIYGGGGSWTIESDKFEKTIQWWDEFNAAMQEVKDDVYIVAEVWTDLQYVEQFYSSNVNAFNFSAYYWAVDNIKAHDGSNWMKEYANHQKNVRRRNANGVEASFLSNHDTGRIASAGGLNQEQLKLANAMNALAPGGSFVYYGDELGLVGNGNGWDDMKARSPMPFANGLTRTNVYMEGTNINSTTVSGNTADADSQNASSLYSSLANVIHYKNENPVLYAGLVSKIQTGNNALGALKYEGSDANYCLFINASNNTVTASIEGDYTKDFEMVTGASSASLDDGSLSMPAYSILIAKGTGEIEVA